MKSEKMLFLIVSLFISLLFIPFFLIEPEFNQKIVVIMLGPPGSGKGTQAAKLAKQLGITHISTGDLFRDNIKRGTKIGKKVQKFIADGELTPDSVVSEMLFEKMDELNNTRGYLLDGYPRRISQAETFRKIFKGECQSCCFKSSGFQIPLF